MENAPPSAVVALPAAPLAANLLLAFDGSGSFDPDPDDSVTSYAWTFRSISAPCAAPTAAGTGPTALVRFACPGSYAVDLTVLDELSARSPVATKRFDVVPHDGPEFVEVGADVIVQHRCSGSPLVCAPTSAIALYAAAPGATRPVAFEWTVAPPPGRELDSTRRVVFLPDRYAASPNVSIETDGTAISGDWLFEVVARDDAGVLGTGVTRVSIGNSEPYIISDAPSPNHAFDGERFSADGEVHLTSVFDPDGDPLPVREVASHHFGDGMESVFSVKDLGTTIAYSIVVPYSSPADAAFLIGGEGLERSIEVALEDVNGARIRLVWPIVVGNRPPVRVSSPAPFPVDHYYDAADSAYKAVASLSLWSDPDGDPMAQAGPTGDSTCARITVTAGRASVHCSLPFGGMSTLRNLAREYVVTEHIGDPWAQAPMNSVVFGIVNRPPAITSTATVRYHVCGNTFCCYSNASGCLVTGAVSLEGLAYASSRFYDPDGDPLDIVAGTAQGVVPVQPYVCTPPACDLPLSMSQMNVCGMSTVSFPVTISDGVATASGTVSVERRCP